MRSARWGGQERRASMRRSARILVTIDEPRGRYYEGEVAAPVFARIALPTLRHLRVPPSTTLSTSPTTPPIR